MNRKWSLIILLPFLLVGCQKNHEITEQSCNNGHEIVFISTTDGYRDIYIVNMNGSELKRLTEPTTSFVYYSSVQWSPNGCQIAFLSDRDRGHENAWGFVPMDIFVMSSNGVDLINLTHNDADNYQFNWSPDGQSILFVSDMDGDFEIYVISSKGKDLVQVTNNDSVDTYPQWSPDGQKIIFLANQDSDSEIFMINLDGTDLKQLTDNNYDEWEFRWSPEGKKIAYTSITENGSEVYIMNIDGTDSYQVTSNQVWDRIVGWSKDGSQLIYTSDFEGRARNLYIFDLTENISRLVTDLEIFESSVVINPDQNMVLVGVNGRREFYLIQLDGEYIEQVFFNFDRVLDFDWR
jgi:TolB protein